jgi:hypothetical protein
MTIPLVGSQGLFTRLGHIAGLINNVNGYLGTSSPTALSTWGTTVPIIDIGHAFDNIFAQYVTTDKNLINNLYPTRDSYRQAHQSLTNFLGAQGSGLAAQTLLQMVNEDVPQKGGPTVQGCLTELIRQMTSSGDSVTKPTVTATVASVVATGDTQIIASVLGPSGIQRDYIYAEVVNMLCTVSSRGTSGFVDTFTAQGNPLASGLLNWDFPTGTGFNGSGCNATIATCDSRVPGSGNGQIIINPFQTFNTTPNVPDSWTIQLGSAGVDFFAGGSSASYLGTNCLQITGTGTNAELRQPLTTLQPSTVYAISVRVKSSGAGLVAGVLEFDLYDTVAAAVLTDANSVACALTVGFGAVTAAYAVFGGFVRTPAILPNNNTNIVFRLKETTPFTNGQSMFIDALAFEPAQDLYGTPGGGPFVAAFGGKTRAALNDKFTLTMANSALTNPYVVTWQKALMQLFSPAQYGLQINSSAGPTISDALLT